MASPQVENGYLQIAMELVDKLSSVRIAGQEWQIVWTIWRKTWGWKKKVDMISLSQFQTATGIDRRKCHSLLQKLIDKNILHKLVTQNGDRKIIKYGFNKDFEAWKLSPKKVTVTNNGAKVSPKMVNTKERKKEKERAVLVIDYLNKVRGAGKFTCSPSNLKHITARLKEGHTVEDCKQVVDTKWKDPDFNKKYFRPSTLFNSEKFEGYLNEDIKPEKVWR